MRVLLLGTGAADGWPNPFCSCASCTWARRAGQVRATTAALVDDVLLLDCGPDAPRAAARAGRSLAGVRHLLLTHAHPDHLAPLALLARSWADPPGRLDVWGPTAAIEECRHWVGPDDRVDLHPLADGQQVGLAVGSVAYRVRALAAAHGDDAPAAGALVYDLAGPTGRLLYATDTGPLPPATVTALAGAAFDLVLLEETFGDGDGTSTGHLDLRTFPAALAELRRTGAVTSATDVVAIHLGHHNPPGPQLHRRLAAWGARTVADLTELSAGDDGPAARSDPAGRVLVLGGARSGKSTHAEALLADRASVAYVATGGNDPADADWRARVTAHRARRPPGWRTVETLDVAGALDGESGPVLVDCLSLWLSRTVDAAGAWTDTSALAAVRAETDRLLAALRRRRAPTVLVSNEVGLGVVPATASGRLFRDELGRLNAMVAAQCDEVVVVVAGIATALRAGRHPHDRHLDGDGHGRS